MSEAMNSDHAQTCPQCDNHCPVDALKCGRGRKYFGVADSGHGHDHHGHDGGHGHPKGGLAGLLHRCGRFVRHTELEEDELFQSLTAEERATLQNLLGKLAADWRERCGEESIDCGSHGHHGHKDGKHGHGHGHHNK